MVYRMFKKLLFITTIIATSFLIQKPVEAAPCPPGQYQYYDTAATAKEPAFKCATVDFNKSSNASGEEFTKGNANAGRGGLTGVLDVDKEVSTQENAGPAWAQRFLRFMVGLSMAVGYFTEVAAMLGIAYASYLYTTSEGDTRKVQQAKMYILYAFSGMFVGAFALVIARMIGGVLGS